MTSHSMYILSLLGYFLSLAGFTLLLCERASDWGTPRWGDGLRAFALVLGGIAWLMLCSQASNSILGVSRIPNDGMYSFAALFGAFAGVAGYWIVRRYLLPRAVQPDSPVASHPWQLRPKTLTAWFFVEWKYPFRKKEKDDSSGV